MKFGRIQMSRSRSKFSRIQLSWPRPKFGRIKSSWLRSKFDRVDFNQNLTELVLAWIWSYSAESITT